MTSKTLQESRSRTRPSRLCQKCGYSVHEHIKAMCPMAGKLDPEFLFDKELDNYLDDQPYLVSHSHTAPVKKKQASKVKTTTKIDINNDSTEPLFPDNANINKLRSSLSKSVGAKPKTTFTQSLNTHPKSDNPQLRHMSSSNREHHDVQISALQQQYETLMLEQDSLLANTREKKVNELEKAIREAEAENEILRRQIRSKNAPSPNIQQLRKDTSLTQYADNCIASVEAPFLSNPITQANVQEACSDTGKPQSKTIKSGYQLKTQIPVTKVVFWPHTFLSDVSQHQNTHPDHLSLEAFAYGYSKILASKFIDDNERQARVIHLQSLMKFTTVHGWPLAREYHYQVLRGLENGLFDWPDHTDIALVGFQTMQQNPTSNQQSKGVSHATPPVPSKDTNPSGKTEESKYRNIICWSFNNESHTDAECRFSGGSNQCKKLHACSACAERGFLHQHKRSDCTKSVPKPKITPVNSTTGSA